MTRVGGGSIPSAGADPCAWAPAHWGLLGLWDTRVAPFDLNKTTAVIGATTLGTALVSSPRMWVLAVAAPPSSLQRLK